MKASGQDIDNFTLRLERIVKAYQTLSAVCDEANKLGTLNEDGKLFDAIWRMFDTLLSELETEMKCADWLNWFIYDCDCGKKKMQVIPASGKRPMAIATPRDLAKLILLEQ